MAALGAFLGGWDPQPVPVVAAVAAGALYAWGMVFLRRGGRPWPTRRPVAFGAGLALWLVVVVGPFGAWDDTFFWAHMVQHLVTMMIVAPLLLLGAPVLLLLAALPGPQRRRWVVPALRSRAVAVLTRPAVSWVLFAGALIGTHFTGFYQAALTHPALHEYVEHPLYLGVALLYFYPLIGVNPLPHGPSPAVKIVSLVLMMAPESMTGFFIYVAGGVLYPAYAAVERPFGPGPLADQQLAGGLMWSSAMVVGAFWVSVAVYGWLKAEARATVRLDRRIALAQAAGR
jgi:cytochrome c oxidase assembly factor CtaG